MVIIIIFIVAIVAIVAIALYHRYKDTRTENPSEEDEGLEEKEQLSDYYSRVTAEGCITKKDYTKPYEDKSLVKDAVHAELWSKLQKVNKHSLVFREPNDMDLWFAQHVRDFCRYADILAYIEHYPELTDSFIANLANPDDSELQKKLISVYGNSTKGFTKVNYVNLLCRFCTKWDLLPEIKAVVMLDPRFETARKIYDLYHT